MLPIATGLAEGLNKGPATATKVHKLIKRPAVAWHGRENAHQVIDRAFILARKPFWNGPVNSISRRAVPHYPYDTTGKANGPPILSHQEHLKVHNSDLIERLLGFRHPNRRRKALPCDSLVLPKGRSGVIPTRPKASCIEGLPEESLHGGPNLAITSLTLDHASEQQAVGDSEFGRY